jgi:RNA polymerase sigma factor (sigma-70 family)
MVPSFNRAKRARRPDELRSSLLNFRKAAGGKRAGFFGKERSRRSQRAGWQQVLPGEGPSQVLRIFPDFCPFFAGTISYTGGGDDHARSQEERTMVEASTGLGSLIVKMIGGDSAAREELFKQALAQLEGMARKRLNRDFGRLRHRGVETGDVLNDAMVEILKRLKQDGGLDAVTCERDFFGLVARHILWGLLNTAKRLSQGRRSSPGSAGPAGETVHPFSLGQMSDFHAAVERLPEDLRQVFDLLYFCNRSYEEAARVLGVSRDTVNQRYRKAKDALKKVLQQ